MPEDNPLTFAGSVDLELAEFDEPPADPVALFRDWFKTAQELGVREPGALALATADTAGRASNRTVQTIALTAEGLVFTSHATSPKGQDIAATGWASGVWYWRETRQQVVVTGPTSRLPDSESDALWHARPAATHPMSAVARQSEPLGDEEALRERARVLAESGERLPRPEAWAGYLLRPSAVEFWHGSADRLHRRLRYDRTRDGWTAGRLQP
ncbi:MULTISPECIES: phenazine biosynthesis FMN-dependent oxidase PhzG [unclassified Streptomyces]|uniref:phenazine biosynthesis FMN-dependent oxidase PhzG n=1 Tax=unclassified Streptomyces TaxID=2593676 RepID=UPI00363FC492